MSIADLSRYGYNRNNAFQRNYPTDVFKIFKLTTQDLIHLPFRRRIRGNFNVLMENFNIQSACGGELNFKF